MNRRLVELNEYEFNLYMTLLNEVTKKSLPDKALRNDELKNKTILKWNSSIIKKDNDNGIDHDDDKLEKESSIQRKEAKKSIQKYSSCYYKCPDCDAKLYQIEFLHSRKIVCSFLRHLAFAHTNRNEDLMPSTKFMHPIINGSKTGNSYLIDNDITGENSKNFDGYVECGITPEGKIEKTVSNGKYEKILYFACEEDFVKSCKNAEKFDDEKYKYKFDSTKFISIDDIVENEKVLLNYLKSKDDSEYYYKLKGNYDKLSSGQHKEDFDTIEYNKEKVNLSNELLDIYAELVKKYASPDCVYKNDRKYNIVKFLNILQRQQSTLRNIAKQKLNILSNITSNDCDEAFTLDENITKSKIELKSCFVDNKTFDGKSSMQEMGIIMSALFNYEDGKFVSKYGNCSVCHSIEIDEKIGDKIVKHKYEPDFLLLINNKKIIVEVDGIWHRENRENKNDYSRKKSDVVRECLLNSKGYYILHIDDLNEIITLSKKSFNFTNIYKTLNDDNNETFKSLKSALYHGIKKIVEGKNFCDSALIKFDGQRFVRRGMIPQCKIINGHTIGDYSLVIMDK